MAEKKRNRRENYDIFLLGCEPNNIFCFFGFRKTEGRKFGFVIKNPPFLRTGFFI